MISFQYSALNLQDKSKTSGTISASDEREARELLREQNLIPTSIQVIKSQTADKPSDGNFIVKLIQRYWLKRPDCLYP
jgi:type II secretory pathway component PulF